MLRVFVRLGLPILTSLLMIKQSYAQENVNHLEKTMQQYLPSFDFWQLYSQELPMSNNTQSIKNIAKIFFYELIDMQSRNRFAIDIERKKLQVSPNSAYLQGGKEFDTNLSDQDIKTLYGLLEKSNIANWKTNYDNASPGLKASGNGYIWNLSLQYNDGTAWYYSGETSPGNPLLPEGYDTLVNGLNALADSKKK